MLDRKDAIVTEEEDKQQEEEHNRRLQELERIRQEQTGSERIRQDQKCEVKKHKS